MSPKSRSFVCAGASPHRTINVAMATVIFTGKESFTLAPVQICERDAQTNLPRVSFQAAFSKQIQALDRFISTGLQPGE
jgi:hypothetical protein